MIDQPPIAALWRNTTTDEDWLQFFVEESEFGLLRNVKLENSREPLFKKAGKFPADFTFSDSSELLYWRLSDFTEVISESASWMNPALHTVFWGPHQDRGLNLEQETMILHKPLTRDGKDDPIVIADITEKSLKVNVTEPNLGNVKQVFYWLRELIASIENLSAFENEYLEEQRRLEEGRTKILV